MKITFLGHKPQELGGFDGNTLQSAIRTQINETLLSLKKPTLLTSITIGIEMWATEIAEANDIKYHAYIPFADYHSKWPFAVRKQYSELLKNANKRVTINDGNYDYKKLIEKDLRLVTDADRIYSFFKEEPAFLRKAIKDGKEVINLLPKGESDDWFISF